LGPLLCFPDELLDFAELANPDPIRAVDGAGEVVSGPSGRFDIGVVSLDQYVQGLAFEFNGVGGERGEVVVAFGEGLEFG